MNRKSNVAVVVAVAALVLGVFSASACTAIVAGKKASATGHVLIGHNEDVGGMTVRHALLPRRDGKPAIFWSEVKNKKGNDVLAHCFYNEYGVFVISNNGGVMTKWDGETYALPDEGELSSLQGSGIGYDLRVRTVEKAHTAREGVDVMTALVEQLGYNQMSRNFIVADSEEAWIVEVIKGRRYVARRVPDDEVVAYPNCLIFNKLRPGDLASRGIREKGEGFDIIAGYQGPRTWKSPYNLHRWQEMYRLVAGVEVEAGDEYPFSVRPAHPISADDIKRGLCSHYECRPFEVTQRHPKKNPKIVVPICRETTVEALVCELSACPADTRFHMTVGRPCEVPYGVYRPFAGTFPPDTVFGKKAADRLDNHRRAPADNVKVALFVGTGVRSNGCTEWIRLLSASPEIDLKLVDEGSVRAGGLEGCDMFVVPGGDSRTVKRELGPEGAEAIRRFVRAGGGYLGTCAGCCLALNEETDPERGIGLIPFHRIGHKDYAMMPVAIGEKGAAALGLPVATREIRYSKGPVLVPVEPATPDMKFETWGTYAGDIADPEKDFVMKGNTAIVGGTFGKGRVFAITCHPESFVCTRDIVQGAFHYVAGRDVTFPVRARTSRALVVGYYTPVMRGIENAQLIQQLDTEAGVDLFPVAADEIRFNMLDHLDVLVLPDGVKDWYDRVPNDVVARVNEFVARGGKVYGWGAGAVHLPKGGVACPISADVLKALRGSDTAIGERSL